MKEHIYKIGLLLLSVCMIGTILWWEYTKEEMAEKVGIDFHVGEEIIQTWEKDGVHYLFLPAFVSQEEVLLTVYSPEFYVINKGRSITAKESIHDIEQGKKFDCQFIETGQKFKLCVVQSQNLPAVFLQTGSGGVRELKADKEYVIPGMLRAVSGDGKEQNMFALKAIGGRGNTSFAGYEKKPFSITLNEADSVLGLCTGVKYALLSNASDPSLIRNDIARNMEMALQLPFSQRGQFVDLYINGEYQGNYYLCADIEVGRERVDITDMEAVMNLIYRNCNYESKEVYEKDYAKARKLSVNPKDITGGYLIEREYVQRFEYEYHQLESTFITDAKEHFVVKNPGYCSVEQIEYIRQYVNEAEKAILSPDGINRMSQKSYGDYIDVDSFVKKYLVEEVSKNYDAGVSSSYFYKDSDLKGGKLCAGPGWDYDMSMGNYVEWMEDFSADPTGISELAFHTYATSWYTKLYQKDEFYEKVKKAYVQTVEPFLSMLLEDGLEEYEKTLEASAVMNEIRWQEELAQNPYYTNREKTLVELKEFLTARKAYLDEAWSKDA